MCQIYYLRNGVERWYENVGVFTCNDKTKNVEINNGIIFKYMCALFS